jgi:protein-disulfide isomerase
MLRTASITASLALAFMCACRAAQPSADSARVVTNSSGTVAPAATAAHVAAARTPDGGFADSTLAHADRARIRGSLNAPIWLVVISDFQCPYCKMWHDQTFPSIDRDYVATGKVRIAYLNFPLSIHRYARPAAEAAMCAAVQDKFWPMQDALFGSQDKWENADDPRPIFESLAKSSGADVAAWGKCMDAHTTMPLIDADYDRASSAGVNSTPTFFVGNEGIEGAQPYEQFKAAIERQLARAAAAPAKP